MKINYSNPKETMEGLPTESVPLLAMIEDNYMVEHTYL